MFCFACPSLGGGSNSFSKKIFFVGTNVCINFRYGTINGVRTLRWFLNNFTFTCFFDIGTFFIPSWLEGDSYFQINTSSRDEKCPAFILHPADEKSSCESGKFSYPVLNRVKWLFCVLVHLWTLLRCNSVETRKPLPAFSPRKIDQNICVMWKKLKILSLFYVWD